jgi:hypothetical protein
MYWNPVLEPVPGMYLSPVGIAVKLDEKGQVHRCSNYHPTEFFQISQSGDWEYPKLYDKTRSATVWTPCKDDAIAVSQITYIRQTGWFGVDVDKKRLVHKCMLRDPWSLVASDTTIYDTYMVEWHRFNVGVDTTPTASKGVTTLSAGAIVGIVLGAIAVVACITTFAVLYGKRASRLLKNK